ncbi:hypothetical protein GLOTRDRAFT_76685 [Gloeophyllum trabeum ATCC 11539]|uniref:Citrate transporter-like domain-containing protein n=1 Tax=Gloeophyllum trabeum (strain ATCC 11539 / FP-39264 / Madison 617) TaxID=670483 RepID=S7RQX8_GLOTA|nr:uncharacterized protein GLOTRDRAFT_76685 [Gloeophyllum trabeum ATCC 11539]EPQ55324.1 hypothetical protein GLOTRDRAFT_76685 [Gloeophyllum trabeum ATCC 11539]
MLILCLPDTVPDVLVIVPLHVPLPHTSLKLPLNLHTAPLLTLFILLAAGAIDGVTIREGILGTGGVKPIDVMALFISLAYLSISLDTTGLFRYLAFRVARGPSRNPTGRSGLRLYIYLYLFWLVIAGIVGNDPVILSGTAFLAYFTRVAGITPPTAWIYAQFVAANMASLPLPPSNPTNLVLTSTFALPFLTYTAHVILPFLLSAFLVGIVLDAHPHPLIPAHIALSASSPDAPALLLAPLSALVGSVLLLSALVLLVATSSVPSLSGRVRVWEVTAPAAGAMVLSDAWVDWRKGRGGGTREGMGASGDPRAQERGDVEGDDVEMRAVRTRFPTVCAVASRMPWALVPFAFEMFILTHTLSTHAWVPLFARWWAAWVRVAGVLGAVGGMGFVGCLACNVCGTNIGATILLSQVLQASFSVPRYPMSEAEKQGAIYALAVGSNYGAFTQCFCASLAGLLWAGILRGKGIVVRQREFAKINFPLVCAAMLGACAVLVAEMYVLYPDR